jgi:outer membrane protein TolC
MPLRIAPPSGDSAKVEDRAASLSATHGSFAEYLAFALEHSPETRAAFERWRAARFATSRPGRLPEPKLSFGYYLKSVETRVGPQRFNVGLSQTIPWPGKLSASKDAASERAQAAALAFDANVLAVRRELALAYWKLWLVDEELRIIEGHDAVLEALAGAVRGRLQTGAASLADLNQVELNIARHHDHHGQHREAAYKASAQLRAVLGAAFAKERLFTSDQPIAGMPKQSAEELVALLADHPSVKTYARLAASANHSARAERADGYPRLDLGINLIETGEATMPGVADSGKDALVVSVGLSLPLWLGSYSDAVNSAEASARVHQAMGQASLRTAEAMLAAALSDVRDAQRRIDLNESTLAPQAEATFQAVLGNYQTGRSTVAAVILAQGDLIALQLEQAQARAEHARSWALLEYIVGRDLEHNGGQP